MAGSVLARQEDGGGGGAVEGIRHYMLGDQVKDEILSRILEGDLRPGSRIVETRIARELGTSQGPVREALHDLAALGLVELHPYRGARVCQPTTEELQEAIGIRSELEALAAAQASAKVTSETLEELKGLMAEMVELAAKGVVAGYVRKNTQFHRTVMRASGNQTLQRLWELLEPFARTYITAAVSGVDAERSRGSHAGILEALASGDPDRAAEAMRLHARENQYLVGGHGDHSHAGTDEEAGTSSGIDSTKGEGGLR